MLSIIADLIFSGMCLLFIFAVGMRLICLLLYRRSLKNTHAHSPAVAHFYPARPRRSTGRKKPEWVMDTVLDLYASGNKSYRVTMHEFNRLYAHTGMTVCLSTVYAWVQRYRSEMELVRKATRNRFPEHRPANVRWCLDGTGKVDANGKLHFILGIVDHGTRMNLLLARLTSATSAAILEQVTAATKLFGKPKSIRTDNASVFRSSEFRTGIARLGIRHEFSQPGKPWQNGRIERFFLTLKQKLNLIVPTDGVALDSLLGEFSTWYNLIRPHQHLHGFTPAEVWRGIDVYQSPPKSVQALSLGVGYCEDIICGVSFTGRKLKRTFIRTLKVLGKKIVFCKYFA